MTRPQMILGMPIGTGHGSQPDVWRAPGVDASNDAAFNARVPDARATEGGMRCTPTAESSVSSS